MNINEYFKFKIGEIVYSGSPGLYGSNAPFPVAATADKGTLGLKLPQPCMVVERILQECHGGVQMFYLVRFYDATESPIGSAHVGIVAKELWRMAEIELMSIDEWNVRLELERANTED